MTEPRYTAEYLSELLAGMTLANGEPLPEVEAVKYAGHEWLTKLVWSGAPEAEREYVRRRVAQQDAFYAEHAR